MRGNRFGVNRLGAVMPFFLFAAGLFAPVALGERPLPLADPGFEIGSGWKLGGGMAKIALEAAHDGRKGLRVIDRDTTRGSDVRSAHVSIPSSLPVALRFFARTRAAGIGVYLDFYDVGGALLTRSGRYGQVILSVPSTGYAWKPFTLTAVPPPGTASATVWIHSFNRAVVDADLDDFTLSVLEKEEIGKVTTTRVREPGSTFARPSPKRVAEIAAWLPERPAPVGWSISDRRTWQRLAADPGAADIVRRAETEAKSPPPELPDALYLEFSRTGNRTNYQRPYGRRSSRLNIFLLAEALENKGRFLPAVRREMEAICSERSWVMPAHDRDLTNFKGTHLTVDLGSSARGYLLATAAGWLGERLPASLRERVFREIERRVWKPYLEAVRAGETRGNWWIKGANNWNPVCTANVIGSALALVPRPESRAEFLAAMEISNPYFISGFTDDGYCSEGVGYWNYGFGHYLGLGLTVRDATGDRLDIFGKDREKLERIARYGLDIQIQPGIAPAFADCSVRAAPAASVLAMIAVVFPKLVPDNVPVPGRLSGGAISVGLLGLRPELENRRAQGTRGATYDLALRTWFRDAQVLICRAGSPAGAPPFGAAIKGGHNAEHHNHNDVGSYVVVYDGHPYLVDPGSEVYTRRTFSSRRYESNVLNSYGHDVPIVAGRLQTAGRRAAARLVKEEFTDSTDRLVLDVAAAYSVPDLKRLVRSFEFDRAKREVRITDSVEFGAPQTFETALVTFDRVHRRSGTELVFYDAKHSVVVRIEADGGAIEVKEDEIENPGRPTPRRFGIVFSQPILKGTVRFTFRPAPLAPDLPGVYAPPDVSGLNARFEQSLVIQAEDFAAQQGGRVRVCDKEGADGLAVKYWDDAGHAIQWRFEVPAGGWFAIEVRSCHPVADAPVTRRVSVDGRPFGKKDGTFVFPETGGWSSTDDNWRDVWLAQGGEVVRVFLATGEHTLEMVNDCGRGLNLDRIRVVPVGAVAGQE
ncbi:MAG: hypothetical protein GXP31_10630 [Kiritimatiellaeota bacterium]|nr:hypothetical protein [Kiritimatiellota bacterium]